MAKPEHLTGDAKGEGHTTRCLVNVGLKWRDWSEPALIYKDAAGRLGIGRLCRDREVSTVTRKRGIRDRPAR